MTEADYKDQFCESANRRGAHAVRHEDRYQVGQPDISMGWGGYDWWFEAKIGEEVPTGQQLDWLNRRRRVNSGRAYVLRFIENKAGKLEALELWCPTGPLVTMATGPHMHEMVKKLLEFLLQRS